MNSSGLIGMGGRVGRLARIPHDDRALADSVDELVEERKRLEPVDENSWAFTL